MSTRHFYEPANRRIRLSAAYWIAVVCLAAFDAFMAVLVLIAHTQGGPR